MSPCDELDEYGLLDGGRMPVGELTSRDECVHEVGWNDQVAQPESRKEDFSKGADVDEAPLCIESLQGFKRSPRLTVVGVVVVCDHPRPGTTRQPEQLQPPGEVHGYAEREGKKSKKRGPVRATPDRHGPLLP